MTTTVPFRSLAPNQLFSTTIPTGIQFVMSGSRALKDSASLLGERTNNHLEGINDKVKHVCSRYVSLSKFFEQFIAVLSSLRNERDHVTLMAMIKKRVATPKDSVEEQILTPYACKFVSKQAQLRVKVSIPSEFETDSTISSSEGALIVTEETCQCSFSWMEFHLAIVIVASLTLSGLDDIKLLSKIRKRGRPKGAEKTAIGLPKKKHKASKPILLCKK